MGKQLEFQDSTKYPYKGKDIADVASRGKKIIHIPPLKILVCSQFSLEVNPFSQHIYFSEITQPLNGILTTCFNIFKQASQMQR